ncbi:MAG TPA: DUF4105 domain-containing protein [Longimicrobium sp.]
MLPFRALALLAALVIPAALPAQAPPAAPDAVPRVFVMTMGPGDLVWERFGHNALWVHDPRRGTDVAYNYGMFDFGQENFFRNFALGRMKYWMAGIDAGATLQHYASMNRSVIVQELNLTPAQATRLADFLMWNELPQNTEYLYDYYRDNCSTRVRDAIDRVLGGRLKAATGNVPAGATYRSHTERLTAAGAADVPMFTALMGGLGPAADRPISRWEEMFLPFSLRDRLRELRVPDATGRMVPLVLSERVAVTSTRPAEPARSPRWLLGYLAAGVALASLLAFLATRAARGRGARFGFAAVAGLWLTFAGTGGWILAGLWTLTDHAIAYRNENMLQLSPLALPLVVLLPALAYGARWAARPAWLLAAAMAALSVLGFVIQPLPGIDQVNGWVIALAMPVNLALAWSARRMAAGLPARASAPPTRGARRTPAPA